MSTINNIRNFAIIAHIDHGKSTIADRIIHQCGGLTEREMKSQVLDSMDIERERGITIKAQTVKLNYKAKNGKNYILNIIDTPGHVDFSYEVSRSLYACEGSILIVDSTQGVEAQTLANVYQALDINHEIIPVLNKIDLPASDLDRTKKQIEDVIGIDTENAIPCSGKTGEGINDILEQIINQLPSPKGDTDKNLKLFFHDEILNELLNDYKTVKSENDLYDLNLLVNPTISFKGKLNSERLIFLLRQIERSKRNNSLTIILTTKNINLKESLKNQNITKWSKEELISRKKWGPNLDHKVFKFSSDSIIKYENEYILGPKKVDNLYEYEININLSKDTNYNEITNMYSKLLQYEPRKVISI